MSLILSYADKYRLWSELTHGNTDRVCILTEERPNIGANVVVQLVIPSTNWQLTVAGTVVGRRNKSAKFPAAIYIRIPQGEVEKCRRFLGLEHDPGKYEKGRKSPRIPCDAQVSFKTPFVAEDCAARNLSDTGIQTTYSGELRMGVRVTFDLHLEEGTLPMSAEVAWLREEDRIAGLRFVDVDPGAHKMIAAAVDRMIRQGGKTGHQIVVADDDPDILGLVSRALTKHGYDVYKARRGEEALSIIRGRKPSLVVLDILMPGIDGLDICKMMRADVEMAEIPVIFLSALEAERLHQIADEAGATDYLCKPVSLADLLNVIGSYLKTADSK